MSAELGQYSTVSYVHALRNERINLGVLVWHPIKGQAIQFARNLGRVKAVDEDASLARVRSELDHIKEVMQNWSKEVESPLEYLKGAFRHNIVVSPPLNARIQDPKFTLERLYSSLMSPEPFQHASSTTQFRRSFAAQMRSAVGSHGFQILDSDYMEKDTFKPVQIAIWYQGPHKDNNVWRAYSFGSLDSEERQLTAAKALHAENEDIRILDKYGDMNLNLAVHLPKPAARSAWDEVLEWLRRTTDRVEPFVDNKSIPAKISELVASTKGYS